MLESGQELSARFVLVRRLGAGGSGSVWLAHDKKQGHTVAVKVLAEELMGSAVPLAALQRECERALALKHPNILRVFGLHRSARHAWITMEYAPGGDLTQLRSRPCAEILRAAVAVANALSSAHRAGLVHRDVKPANVLLLADGTPKLADFGVALTVAEAPPHAAHGSKFNMSPQQMLGAPAAAADDIYGFGALLYELLSGYPPFYPEVTAAKIRSQPVPALPKAAQWPDALVALIYRCLAKSPGDRPASMAVIEAELQEILPSASAARSSNSSVSMTAPMTSSTPTSPDSPATSSATTSVRIAPPSVRPVVGQGETLRGEWHRSAASNNSNEDELRRQGFRRGLTVAAAALGVVGVIVVFFLLPKWVEPTEPAATYPQAAAAPVEEPKAEEEKKKELDFAALARAKQQVDAQRDAIDPRLEQLRAQAVEEWGGADYRSVTDKLASADKHYEAREYLEAAADFTAVEPLLTALEGRVGQVLAEQLAAGSAALSEGRSADAKIAFEFANRIEPGNAAAARGLKRAGTLDEVLALLTKAEGLEKQGQPSAAAEVFRQALALDGETTRATAGLQRVGAQVAADAFAANMARGFNALAQGKYADARNSFQSAGRIRPNAPEVEQALKQVEQDERTSIIAAKLAEAREAEKTERWADALKTYQSILQLDSTVAFASEGVTRVKPRADLNTQLEMYLTQPERLFSIPVRTAARETLRQASNIASPGPVLRQQMAKLDEWVKRSDSPVQVALQSDNATQVTIYRVGALGAFEQRSLELVPGNYVVVGTRPGYRDVRREINVVPGAALPPVVIRCEDKI